MLVKYIGQKQRSTVWLPIGTKSHSEWERAGSKALSFAKGEPTQVPDSEAMKLIRLDPQNFDLVTREAEVVEADVHEGLVEDGHIGLAGLAKEVEALDGTEFAEAIEAEPVKRRGRKKA